MTKYRTKPVLIEAFIMGFDDYPVWFTEQVNKNNITLPNKGDPKQLTYHSCSLKYCTIKTIDGEMKGDYGDYIIKGIQGEVYPCKPDIFEQTYELIENAATFDSI